MTETLRAVLYWSTVVCFVYLLAVHALYLVLLLAGAVEGARRRHEAEAEDFSTLAHSRFTIPVSILVPAFNEEPIIAASVRSLLAIDYPEFEVVVVNDGSRDGTLELLKRELALLPRQVFFRRLFPTRPIRAVYRSAVEPRLTVVDKENGGKADALNCAFNFSRYRYVLTVDADSTYTRDALLKGMRLAMQDPGRVIAVTSQVTVSERPEAEAEAASGGKLLSPRPILVFQHLDFLRSFLASRLAWSRFHFMLSTTGVFSLWRRDVIEELGGFSTRFTCEDIEMTFRAHQRFRREKRPYAILSLPDNVAFTEGPRGLRALVLQRERWQRVIDETVWHYRRMLFNPRYGAVGLLGLPYYVLYEVLGPMMELVAWLSLALAAALGVLGVREFLLYLGAVSSFNAILAAGAILLREQGEPRYRLREIALLMTFALSEFVLYRPVLFVARLKGTWGFLRGDKSWHKFERNRRAVRVETPAAAVPLWEAPVQAGKAEASLEHPAVADRGRAATSAAPGPPRA